DQADHLALLDAERDVVDREQAGEAEADPVDRQEAHAPLGSTGRGLRAGAPSRRPNASMRRPQGRSRNTRTIRITMKEKNSMWLRPNARNCSEVISTRNAPISGPIIVPMPPITAEASTRPVSKMWPICGLAISAKCT